MMGRPPPPPPPRSSSQEEAPVSVVADEEGRPPVVFVGEGSSRGYLHMLTPFEFSAIWYQKKKSQVGVS